MKSDREKQTQEIQNALTPELAAIGRAVAVSSMFVELNKTVCTVKELVEGFCKRYKGELEEAVVMENMNGALATAFTMQLVNAPEETLKELYETEQLTPEMTFTLTPQGQLIGADWLLKLKTGWPGDPARN